MAETLLLNQQFVVCGLDTLNYTIPTTGLYNVQVQSTIPSAVATGDGAGSGGNGSQGAPIGSSLEVQVTQNGTPLITVSNPPATQGAGQFKIGFSATAADAISVVLSSSASIDKQLNTVKSIISIGQGL